MYREFYGLRLKPFSKTPDPGFLYLGREHEEALERLRYAVEEREIMVLTGNIGCGKTTLTRALLDSLDESHRVIMVLNPRLTPTQLLRVVARRFDVKVEDESKDSLLEAIHERIFRDYDSGVTPVVIVDEAQLIPWRETFDELRLLTNYQLDDQNLVSLVLVGQTELRKKLDLPALEPLRQRVGLFYHIGPLTEEDMGHYISHRLRLAGRAGTLFTDGALKSIYGYTGGLPRLINSLSNLAMLEGFSAGSDFIDSRHVEAASRELGLGGQGFN